MLHAEALLLVDDDQSQIVRIHIAREQPVRAHEHLHVAFGEALQGRLLLLGRAEARKHFHGDVEGVEAVFEGGVVLLGQNGGRTEHHHLLAILGGLEGGAQGHLGLAEADVSADETVHRSRRFHVVLHIGDGGELIAGLGVGEGLLHLALPGGVRREAEALGGGAAGVDVHEVEGELLGGLAGAVHGPRPVARVQAGKTGAAAFRPHVAGHAVELLHGDEQLVALGVFQLQVVALSAVHLAAHQITEKSDAVGRVHHVVAGLEREGDLGGIHAGAHAAAGGARALGVGGRHQREMRFRDDHAERDVVVHDVDDPAPQAAFGLGRGVGLCAFGLRLAIVQIFWLHNLDGNTVVDEGVAHGLAGAQVRSREDDGVAVGGEALQLAEYFVGHPGHIDALHRQLVVQRAANPHDGDIGGPHLAPEVQRRRLGEQARERDVGTPGALGDVICGVGRIIEERTRLDEGRTRARSGVGAQRHRLLVQKRQHHIGAVEAKPPFQLLQHIAQSRVGERRLPQGAPRVGQRPGGGGELGDGVNLHGGQRRDGLPRGGHNAADLVQLVAEEVEPHRKGQVAGEHIHGAAAHGEGARTVQLAGIGVAGGLQGAGQVAQLLDALDAHILKLLAGRKRDRPRSIRLYRRQQAQQRPGARHHHDFAAALERPGGLHALGDDAAIGRLGVEGVIRALREAQHALLPHIGGHVAGEGDGGVLAGHDDERGLGRMGEAGRHEEGPRRGGHTQGGVLAGIELSPERVQAAGLLQGEGERIDEHSDLFSARQTAKAARAGGRHPG